MNTESLMVPTVTAAEGEKPNVHSTEPADTAKPPLADSTEGQQPHSQSLGCKFSHRIQTWSLRGSKSIVWWDVRLLSVGLVRATGLGLAEAVSGLSLPKGERGLPRELQPPARWGRCH